MPLTDVLTLDDAVSDRAAESLAGLLFVSIVSGTVQETVACLDSVVDGLVESLSNKCFLMGVCVRTSAQVDLVT